MKFGLPTVSDPDNPDAFYFRILYREWYFGPFATEAEVTEAINHLDRTEVWWDYDPFILIKGANPLPDDYVFGFPVPAAVRDRIEAQRLPFEQRPQPPEPPHA